MPIYEYKHTGKKGKDCEDPFEVMQQMSDEPLTECPTCGKPVEKILSAFRPQTNMMSTSNLKEKGFTKLVRRDKGVYERE